MSVIARRICATPARSAADAWRLITEIICQDNSDAATEFGRVTGIASSLIADEAFKDEALVIIGAGPRLRVYCLYDEEAVTADNRNEGKLTWKPADSDWKAYLPCPSDDLNWVTKSLKERSSRFIAYDIKEGLKVEEATMRSTAKLEIDAEAFNRL